MNKKDRERINKYIKIENNGCWTWKGCINNNHIPVIFIYGKTTSVKRLLYCDSKYATIPVRLKVRSTCGNPLCVNPSHIEEVTSPMETTGNITVNNVKYNSAYTVNKKLKIPLNLVKRFTRQGVFDVEEYRQFCIKTNREYVI